MVKQDQADSLLFLGVQSDLLNISWVGLTSSKHPSAVSILISGENVSRLTPYAKTSLFPTRDSCETLTFAPTVSASKQAEHEARLRHLTSRLNRAGLMALSWSRWPHECWQFVCSCFCCYSKLLQVSKKVLLKN